MKYTVFLVCLYGGVVVLVDFFWRRGARKAPGCLQNFRDQWCSHHSARNTLQIQVLLAHRIRYVQIWFTLFKMLKQRSLLSNLAISGRSVWLEPYLFYDVGVLLFLLWNQLIRKFFNLLNLTCMCTLIFLCFMFVKKCIINDVHVFSFQRYY